jgi:hypothetical protein
LPLFTRIGVAVAATVFTSGIALGAAGAHAQTPEGAPVFTSVSAVSATGKGETTRVAYNNRSGQGLVCGVLVGQGRLLSDIYDAIRSSQGAGGIPEDLSAELALAMDQGRAGILSFAVEDGGTAVVTDGSFIPAAMATCSNLEFDPEYVEVELSPGAGVPSGLGSLDAALTGFGSSGSVARTSGSLGS